MVYVVWKESIFPIIAESMNQSINWWEYVSLIHWFSLSILWGRPWLQAACLASANVHGVGRAEGQHCTAGMARPGRLSDHEKFGHEMSWHVMKSWYVVICFDGKMWGNQWHPPNTLAIFGVGMNWWTGCEWLRHISFSPSKYANSPPKAQGTVFALQMNGERKRAGGHRGCFGTNNQAHWVLYSLRLKLLHLICFHWDSLLTWNLCPHVWNLRFWMSLKKECYP